MSSYRYPFILQRHLISSPSVPGSILPTFVSNRAASLLQSHRNSFTTAPLSSPLISELAQLFTTGLTNTHWILLRALSHHLARIAAQEKVNRMPLSNLGFILSPTLGLSPVLLTILVEHRDPIFRVVSGGENDDEWDRRKRGRSDVSLRPNISSPSPRPDAVFITRKRQRHSGYTNSASSSSVARFSRPASNKSMRAPFLLLRPFSSLDSTTPVIFHPTTPSIPTPIADHYSSTTYRAAALV